MKRLTALILVLLGFVLPVILAILLNAFFDVDPGKHPHLLVLVIMTGVPFIASARRFWRRADTAGLALEPIPAGYRRCDRCKKTLLPEPDFALRGYGELVCDSCSAYRNKRALLVMLCFMVPLAACGLAGFLLAPDAKKKR
jgi:hypothetical protein